MTANVLNIIVVGLGHQSQDDHLPAITESPMFQLVGVVDINLEVARETAKQYNVEYGLSVTELLAKLNMTPDAALIAVPHAGYMSIIEDLAKQHVHIIKEKPFAISVSDAEKLIKIVEDNNITLQVTLQRRFNPIFKSYEQLIKRIGKLYSIEARYTMNISRLDEGWRASRLFAGGGALIDLGYHYVDLIVWYFGLPDSVVCKLSTGNRDGQKYDVEDTVMLDFAYGDHGDDGDRVLGNLIVSRVYPDKDESLVAYGSKGSVAVRRGVVVRRDVEGNEIECLERTGSWPSALIDQLEQFAANIISGEHNGRIERRYLEQVALVESAYSSAREHITKNPHDYLRLLMKDKRMQLAMYGGPKTIDEQNARFIWPVIDAEAENTILSQLKDSISLYDKSGIFASFEDDFATYHSRNYGLLSNSGTSSIFAMYEAINLQPGDEVLCPVYTFHATVSPMMYTGAVPIFCDSDVEGNISLEAIKDKASNKTKAVIVTHMWGTPVRDIVAIAEFCRKRGIYLLEDCSHAHGASIDGKKVGSFGDMSAWSLQGQKIITGGEGGILLTDDKTLYDRALLQGHYNKRPKTEIEDASPLKKFFLTGMGLKLRAHPMAIALANQQFSHLDEFISQKEINARRFSNAFKDYDFLDVPTNNVAQNSWYAYGLHYNHDKAYGVTRAEFVEALHAEGLIEADMPGSTGLLSEVPLFTSPDKLMPRLYKDGLPLQSGFPLATRFHNSLIKFPVWAMPGDDDIVQSYIDGVCKVAEYIATNKTIARI